MNAEQPYCLSRSSTILLANGAHATEVLARMRDPVRIFLFPTACVALRMAAGNSGWPHSASAAAACVLDPRRSRPPGFIPPSGKAAGESACHSMYTAASRCTGMARKASRKRRAATSCAGVPAGRCLRARRIRQCCSGERRDDRRSISFKGTHSGNRVSPVRRRAVGSRV